MIQFRITKTLGQELEACHPYAPALTKVFYGRTFGTVDQSLIPTVAIKALTEFFHAITSGDDTETVAYRLHCGAQAAIQKLLVSRYPIGYSVRQSRPAEAEELVKELARPKEVSYWPPQPAPSAQPAPNASPELDKCLKCSQPGGPGRKLFGYGCRRRCGDCIGNGTPLEQQTFKPKEPPPVTEEAWESPSDEGVCWVDRPRKAMKVGP